MTLSREDLVREILTHKWRAPILRVITSGPARYGEIRTKLFEQKGESPGDGSISAELRGLRDLGLVSRKHVPGTRRSAWALTDLGSMAVGIVDALARPGIGVSNEPNGDLDDHARAAPAYRGAAGGAEPRRGLRGTPVEDSSRVAAAIDPDKPHPARRYNYWLGGKDNFAADRASGDEFERLLGPAVRIGVRANRDLLRRAVRYLAAEAGVRQFLDIGTGLPTADNTHEVAQSIAPESRVLYVDNDPLVLAHARALLTSSPEGKTAYVEADLRDPDAILRNPALADTLDLTQPVALMLVAVLHFIAGQGAAQPIVRRLMDALPAGSFLVVTHATTDFTPPEIAAAHQKMYDEGRSDIWARNKQEIAALFDGLELIEPGIVPNSKWRPEPDAPEIDLQQVAGWAGVGRKETSDRAGVRWNDPYPL